MSGAERGRIVWRVLAEMPDFRETFHKRAAEAFLDAQAMEKAGAKDVEVNRVTLRAGKLSRVDLLSRVSVFEKSEVVPVETWRGFTKRVRPVGAAAERAKDRRCLGCGAAARTAEGMDGRCYHCDATFSEVPE